jgi:hypothetical protein
MSISQFKVSLERLAVAFQERACRCAPAAGPMNVRAALTLAALACGALYLGYLCILYLTQGAVLLQAGILSPDRETELRSRNDAPVVDRPAHVNSSIRSMAYAQYGQAVASRSRIVK